MNDVNFGVGKLHTVLRFTHSILIIETIYKGFIITTLSSKVIQTFFIVDPESNIPGLIILPTVILSGEQIALVGCSHWRKSVGGFVLMNPSPTRVE